MSEQAAPATTTEPATPAATTETVSPLEKVYSDFNIEETASTFQQPQSTQPAETPAVQHQPQAPKVPDPFDPNFAAYQQAVAQNMTVLHRSVSEATGKLNALERQLHQRQTESDIKSAVGQIAEKAGIDPDVAEVALEVKARKDPKFLTVWNNRQKNPKAYSAAIQAFSQEAQQRFTVRQDPQLAENQRAVKVSQQQMATTQARSQNDEWADMTPVERQAKVRLLMTRG